MSEDLKASFRGAMEVPDPDRERNVVDVRVAVFEPNQVQVSVALEAFRSTFWGRPNDIREAAELLLRAADEAEKDGAAS